MFEVVSPLQKIRIMSKFSSILMAVKGFKRVNKEAILKVNVFYSIFEWNVHMVP